MTKCEKSDSLFWICLEVVLAFAYLIRTRNLRICLSISPCHSMQSCTRRYRVVQSDTNLEATQGRLCRGYLKNPKEVLLC
ncbi:hypothetical protein F5882DRAFT_99929 [Hyaloscypha sp. PMI_1271]|nr:hypothetical protein F5882DRAFT_99929 [Hyaloscypha sp. PMI_1271]